MTRLLPVLLIALALAAAALGQPRAAGTPAWPQSAAI